MKQNNMNFITTNLNKIFNKVRKIYYLKLLYFFFIKDPNKSRPDPQHWLYVPIPKLAIL